MENEMNKQHYKEIESKLKQWYEQIKKNPNHKTNDGNTFEKVKEF